MHACCAVPGETCSDLFMHRTDTRKLICLKFDYTYHFDDHYHTETIVPQWKYALINCKIFFCKEVNYLFTS